MTTQRPSGLMLLQHRGVAELDQPQVHYHYVFLSWTQAMLLHRSWGALPKAAVVFALVLRSSWAVTALPRLNRAMRRVV